MAVEKISCCGSDSNWWFKRRAAKVIRQRVRAVIDAGLDDDGDLSDEMPTKLQHITSGWTT